MSAAEPDPPPSQSPEPQGNGGESTASLLGQFLTFIGPIVTFAGIIAIMRTGERSLFYAAMAPVGLIMFAAGYWLNRRR